MQNQIKLVDLIFRDLGLAQKLFVLRDNPDMPLEQGQTALILAAKNANVEMTQLLLTEHADTNKCDNYGETALMYAVMPWNVRASTLQIVQLLVAAGADCDTALMWACYYKHDDIEKFLVAAGADTTLVDKDGYKARTLPAPEVQIFCSDAGPMIFR